MPMMRLFLIATFAILSAGSGSEAVQLSGLLALPRDVVPRRLVSFQHGEEALAAARSMQARSVDVAAIDVGAVGYDPSMLAAAPLILAWLRELDRARRRGD